MRRGLLLVLALLIAWAITAQAAGAGSKRAYAAHTDLGTLKLKLPPGGRGQIWELVLKVKAQQGSVGSLDVRDPNESKLPPGIRAIAVITPTHSSKRTATFQVFVAINNLAGGAAAADVSFAHLKVYEYAQYTGGRGIGMKVEPADCERAVALGNSVDSHANEVKVSEGGRVAEYGEKYTLEREASPEVQTSSNEFVLDNTVFRQCPHTPGVENPSGESPTSLN